MTHTKEPWHHLVPEIPKLVYGKNTGKPQIAEFKFKADAERATICVNALAGIENPAEWVERAKKAMEGETRWLRCSGPDDILLAKHSIRDEILNGTPGACHPHLILFVDSFDDIAYIRRSVLDAEGAKKALGEK